MEEIKIYCDQGHWRWNVATFSKNSLGKWAQKIIETDKSISIWGKSGDQELWSLHGHRDSRDDDFLIKPPNYNWVKDGQEVSGFSADTPQGGRGVTPSYDIFCEQCKKHKRHKSVLSNHDRLCDILDLISKSGQVEVTVEHLGVIVDKYNRDRARR